MGALTVIVAAIGGLLMAALASQLAVEFRDWTPRWTEMLINRAVSRLPPELQERMAEEWREFVADAPGHIIKLKRALGLSLAATRVTADFANGTSLWPRIFTRTFGATVLLIELPLLALIVAVLLTRNGPVFEKARGRKYYRFRTSDDDRFAWYLRRLNLDALPGLWNFVNGDVTLGKRELKILTSNFLGLLKKPSA